jgi:hypothetical protein
MVARFVADDGTDDVGRALFVLKVHARLQREVLAAALLLGMQGAGGAGELLFLAPTSDPEELGRLAQQLAGLDGVRDVSCAVVR